MAKQTLTFEALQNIGGGLLSAGFDEAVERVDHDCRDRPTVGEARKITIEVQLTPAADQRGNLDHVAVAFVLKDTMPKRKTPTYVMKPGRDGLQFNELSRDNPDQGTLDTVTPMSRVQGDQ